jgi:hypothetical protein
LQDEFVAVITTASLAVHSDNYSTARIAAFRVRKIILWWYQWRAHWHQQ